MKNTHSFCSDANQRKYPPPSDTDMLRESEQAILGKILWIPKLIKVVQKKLSSGDFRYERHQVIFQAMIDLEKEGDPVSTSNLWEHLREIGKLGIAGGIPYITYLPLIALDEQIERDTRETNKILAWIKRKGITTNG